MQWFFYLRVKFEKYVYLKKLNCTLKCVRSSGGRSPVLPMILFRRMRKSFFGGNIGKNTESNHGTPMFYPPLIRNCAFVLKDNRSPFEILIFVIREKTQCLRTLL